MAPLAPQATGVEVGRLIVASYIASRVSDRSKRAMHQSLARAARALNYAAPEEVQWHRLTFLETSAIRAALLRPEYARATCRLTLVALRGVLKQAKRLRFMTRDAFDEATDWDKPPKVDELPAGRALSRDEIDKINAWLDAQADGPWKAFLGACLALMLGTGLRAEEACGLTVDAVDFEARRVRVLRKGGKKAEVPIGGAEVEALLAWVEERKRFARRVKSPALLLRVSPSDWVSPKRPTCNRAVMSRICTRIAKGAGVALFSPHDLRRTFCTLALKSGKVDVHVVQDLMGHVDPATTKKYDRRGAEAIAENRQTWDVWRPASPGDDPTPASPSVASRRS